MLAVASGLRWLLSDAAERTLKPWTRSASGREAVAGVWRDNDPEYFQRLSTEVITHLK